MTQKLNNKFKKTEIGEIPEDWDKIPKIDLNDDAFEFQNGLWEGKTSDLEEAIVIRGTNFNSYGKIASGELIKLLVDKKQLEKRTLKEGDIIIERSGGGPKQPVGRVAYFEIKDKNIKYSFSNFTTRLRILDKDKFLLKYVFYYLLNFYNTVIGKDFQFGSNGIRNLDFTRYKNEAKIPLLNKQEQEKIAGFLSRIQGMVENQEKLIERLKELKSSTMAKLFTEGLYNKKRKKTEIGEIPEDWEVKELSEVSKDIFAGGDVPKNNFSKFITDKYKIPIYTNGEKQDGLYGYTNIIKVAEPSLTISSRGTIGYCVVRKKPYYPAIRLIVILPDNKKVDLLYLKFALDNVNFERHFDKSPIPQLTIPMVKPILIPLPPKSEQDKIADILDRISKEEEIAQKKLEKYKELFSAMLNQLMTGKIRLV